MCRFCGDAISDERAEIYSHCTRNDCVVMWKRERLADYRLSLVPKQGFQIVSISNEFLKVGGRSSGKV